MEQMVTSVNGDVKKEEAVKRLKVSEKVAPAPAPASAGKSTASSTRTKVIAGASAAAVLLGLGYWLATRGWVTTDDAFIEGHVVPVSAKAQGHVLRVLVEDNQVVKKDDVLAEIEPQDYETKRDAARADVEGAQASVRETELDAKRYQSLFDRQEASRQTLDHAQTEAQSARARLASAEARLRQAELDLSYTQIKAPEAGRVTRKTLEAGEFVAVGQPLLAVVPTDVWVVANFKETQLRDMKPGQEAEISVDAYPGKLKGRVDSLQAGTGARFSVLPPENATGNFVKVVQRMPVKIVLDGVQDAKLLLAPGMSVEAEVKVQ